MRIKHISTYKVLRRALDLQQTSSVSGSKHVGRIFPSYSALHTDKGLDAHVNSRLVLAIC